MRTLDEAIERYRHRGEMIFDGQRAIDARQIADWLEELRDLRSKREAEPDEGE